MKRIYSILAALALTLAVAACTYEYPRLDVGGSNDSGGSPVSSGE